ncbi:YfcZ/YiiS family protein [Vibrio sp. CDRSL-10 TSBA]
MSNQTYREPEVCEACGVAGEMGFIIREGDDVAEVTIFADSEPQMRAELDKYLTLAQQVNKNVEHEVMPLADDAKEMHVRFKFEVSAEKLIFELRSRSLAR